MTPERKIEIETCVERLYAARGRLGAIEAERFREDLDRAEPMSLDFEKRYAVALAEHNEIEAELREMTGPNRDLLSSFRDSNIATDGDLGQAA